MNKKLLFSALLLTLFTASLAANPVSAARPADKKPGGGGGDSSSTPVGNDISWPQCGKRLPSGQAFGIVGVNGGTAANTNPCLADQLVWAAGSSGAVASQDKVQLYVNTANPGEVIDQINTWPIGNTASVPNPYGECDGTNTAACSWQYGWNRGEFAVEYFRGEAVKAGIDDNPAGYKWWLDVETMNTWQSGSPEAYQRNVAALEGWVAYFSNIKARTGIYSTAYQWGEITGGEVSTGSNLNGLDSWLAGSKTLKGAQTKCGLPPLTTGGIVALTQYVSGGFDYDYACF